MATLPETDPDVNPLTEADLEELLMALYLREEVRDLLRTRYALALTSPRPAAQGQIRRRRCPRPAWGAGVKEA